MTVLSHTKYENGNAGHGDVPQETNPVLETAVFALTVSFTAQDIA